MGKIEIKRNTLGDVLAYYGLISTTYCMEILIGSFILSICLASVAIAEYKHPDSVIHVDSYQQLPLIHALKLIAIMLLYRNCSQLRRFGANSLLSGALLLSIIDSALLTWLVVPVARQVPPLDLLAVFILLAERGSCVTLAEQVASRPGNHHHAAYMLKLHGPDLLLDALVKVLALAGGAPKSTLCASVSVCLVSQSLLTLLLLPACVSALPLLGANRVSPYPIDVCKNPVQRRAKLVMVAGLAVLHLYQQSCPQITDDVIQEDNNNNTSWLTSFDTWFIIPLTVFTILKYIFWDKCSGEMVMVTNREVSTQTSSDTIRHVRVSERSVQVTQGPDTSTFSPGRRRRAFSTSDSEHHLFYNRQECEQMKLPDVKSAISARKCAHLFDEQILDALRQTQLKSRELEDVLGTAGLERAVGLRRRWLAEKLPQPESLRGLPWRHYTYRDIYKRCCEQVIGFAPVPMGVAGPLILLGPGSDTSSQHWIPLATTEGCLVASAQRGCRVTSLAGGICAAVTDDGMARAPVVRFKSLTETLQCKMWLESSDGQEVMRSAFESTSTHAVLNGVQIFCASGRELHLRFHARTGEAMGMNMVSKGCAAAIVELQKRFPSGACDHVTLSGNMCTDKKPSAVNWLLGRGKSVIAECVLSRDNLSMLKVSPRQLAELCVSKNFVGSAMAGSLGGQNAHAANPVAAMFIATGQDCAQVVEAAHCLTWLQWDPETDSLYCSVRMPAVEVATIGGGTELPAQRAALRLLDLDPRAPTEHLARLVAATVLCCELSLMAAQISGDLVSSHLRLNRRGAEAKQHPLT